MNEATSLLPMIDVADLRVGMHVHLQGGWLAHPFALGSFRLSSAGQIATLRSLGLTRVAWSPEKSDPPGWPGNLPPRPAPADPAPPSDAAEAETDAPAGTDAGVGIEPGIDSEAGRCARREALAAHRAGLQRCERLFAQATATCRRVTDVATARPRAAGRQAAALARDFVDRMIADGQSCIRLLTEGAGDKASAHAVNVTLISLLLGRATGLTEDELVDLGTGALLHDIGKLDLPAGLRHHDERLGAAEAAVWQQHVAHGVERARRMELTERAALVVEQHHEHDDGSGFPSGRAGDRIAVGARIVGLVDRYDRLCNPPVPTAGMTPHEALSLLFTQGRNRFDGMLLGGLVKLLGVYPPGSTVQLTDGRHALVIAVDPGRPLRPSVIVHDPAVPPDEALPLDLARCPALGIRRSLKPLALPREALAYLSPRSRTVVFFEPARLSARREAGYAA